MYTHLFEVMKEYIMFVEGLDFSVKGRVTQSTNQEGEDEFHWEISHYYRTKESAAAVYIPSKKTTKSFELTKSILMAYMKGFTTIGVKPNERY